VSVDRISDKTGHGGWYTQGRENPRRNIMKPMA